MAADMAANTAPPQPLPSLAPGLSLRHTTYFHLQFAKKALMMPLRALMEAHGGETLVLRAGESPRTTRPRGDGVQ